MCGICGLLDGTKSTEREPIVDMFLEIESRGRDASGFAAAQASKLWYYRENVKATKLVKTVKDLKIEGAKTWVGHCRLATHGSAANNNNNHPFIDKGLALIHNGIINNHAELGDELKFEYEGECDTEGIIKTINYFRLAEEGLSVTDAIAKACSKLAGDMACALINRSGEMWLWRRGWSPLHVATKLGEPVLHFASTRAALDKSLPNSGRGWCTAEVEEGDGYYIKAVGRSLKVEPFTVPDCPDEDLYSYYQYRGYNYSGMYNAWSDIGKHRKTGEHLGKYWCMLCSSYHDSAKNEVCPIDATQRGSRFRYDPKTGKSYRPVITSTTTTLTLGTDVSETEEEVEEEDAPTSLARYIWLREQRGDTERITSILCSINNILYQGNRNDYFICEDCSEDFQAPHVEEHVVSTGHRHYWRSSISDYLGDGYCEDCGREEGADCECGDH